MLKYILTFIPLLGTSLGALLGISSFKDRFEKQEDTLVAVATGILCSIAFNLLTEAVEFIRYISVFFGLLFGFLFVFILNIIAKKKNLNIRSKLFWAMIIHNIPEGIVIGIPLADKSILPATVSLIASITLQNLPDGFVVSMPLVSKYGKKHALLLGILSGVVEPLAAVILIIAAGETSSIQSLEPFLIGFSFSSIFTIVLDLLKECRKGSIVITSAIITLLFNSILG